MLFNDFVRPVQHRLWNRYADLFRCLEIDHELKLRRLLDWNVGDKTLLGTIREMCGPNLPVSIDTCRI